MPITSSCFNEVSINFTAIFIWSLSISRDFKTPSMREKLFGKSVTNKISFSPGSRLVVAVDDIALILPLEESTSLIASDAMSPLI